MGDIVVHGLFRLESAFGDPVCCLCGLEFSRLDLFQAHIDDVRGTPVLVRTKEHQ